jgi:tRNA (cmo5U34)-methyltransferase
VSTNLWVNEDHALAYLRERDSLPHRVDAYEQVLELLPASVERVLDLGTGDGVLLDLVLTARPGASGVGLDFGDEMLRRAAERFAGRPVELVRHNLDAPVPDLGSFDAVISSFAIHHCSPARVKVLYAEVFDLLRPGGVFVNAEHVASTTPRLHEEFLARLGRTLAEDDPSNQLVGTEEHLNWLTTCGFENVDCFWKWRELAVVAGDKSACV